MSPIPVPSEAPRGLPIIHSAEEFIGLSEFLRGLVGYLQVRFGLHKVPIIHSDEEFMGFGCYLQVSFGLYRVYDPSQ